MGISGKCDFEDYCTMFHDPWDLIKHYKIYAAENDVIPLRFEKPSDLIAYYPYLISTSYGNQDGTGTVHLAQRSFIDTEEEEMLRWRMNNAKIVYRRCKRNHVPFDRKAAEKAISLFDELRPFEIEILDRVEQDGEKASIEGLHDALHDRMRDEWYQLMVDNGWEEPVAYRWVYGWRRYFDRYKTTKHGEHTEQQVLNLEGLDVNSNS